MESSDSQQEYETAKSSEYESPGDSSVLQSVVDGEGDQSMSINTESGNVAQFEFTGEGDAPKPAAMRPSGDAALEAVEGSHAMAEAEAN